MLDLLQQYSLEQIIMFIILLALAFKGLVDFYDWGKRRFSTIIDKEHTGRIEKSAIKEDIDKLYQIQVVQNEAIDKLSKSVNLLLSSDKDEIKAWITEKHHYFCYEVKYIDDYSLDCLERRYSHYKDEGGNSFIADLMNDLRSLPKVSSTLSRQEIQKNNKEEE